MTPSSLKYIDDNLFQLPTEERIIGFYLYDRYNNEVDRVRGLMVEPDTFTPRFLVLEIGGLMSTGGKFVLVPRPAYHPEGLGRALTESSRESLQTGPSIHDPAELTREEEQVVISHFDLEPYWENDAQWPVHQEKSP